MPHGKCDTQMLAERVDGMWPIRAWCNTENDQIEDDSILKIQGSDHLREKMISYYMVSVTK